MGWNGRIPMSLVADLAKLLGIEKPESPYSLTDTVYYRVASLHQQHGELRKVTLGLSELVQELTKRDTTVK